MVLEGEGVRVRVSHIHSHLIYKNRIHFFKTFKSNETFLFFSYRHFIWVEKLYEQKDEKI
jgi:hypothetical protein